MIAVSKMERKMLESVGLLRDKKTGRNPEDANYVVINRSHKSRNKKCYVVEEQDTLLFLEKYDKLNLQKVSKAQIDKLKKEKLLKDSQIQHSGEYVPGALAFQDRKGQWRIKKVTSFMIALSYWKPNYVRQV